MISVVWHAIALFIFDTRSIGTDDIRLKKETDTVIVHVSNPGGGSSYRKVTRDEAEKIADEKEAKENEIQAWIDKDSIEKEVDKVANPWWLKI